MRAASYALCDMIADKLQIKQEAPSVVVYVKQRYWGEHASLMPNSDIDSKQQWYQLTNQALSVEVSENVDSFASSFNITFTNEAGKLAPDNFTYKWPLDINFRGHDIITYAGQLMPNNEIRIYLGYGDELIPFIHGYVGDTKVSADGQTIGVSCMTSYKHIIHQTVKEKQIKAPKGNLFDVLKFYFDKAGVVLKGSKVMVPGTTSEQWIIKDSKGLKGQSYDEIVRELIDTTFHYIRPNFDGSCTLMQVPNYLQSDSAEVIFDEMVNLTALDYTLTDQDVYCAVQVKCGEATSSFVNTYIHRRILLGKFREEVVDVPWANSYRKRKEVAKAAHTKNMHKIRTLNIGVVGDPRLELWDRVGVREQTSSMTDVFHIKGMQTMISDAGFFQVLDLAINFGYEPTPPSDLSPIQVSVDTIRLKIWDWDREDGDLLNIYCDEKTIAKNYFIRNNATYVDIPLKMGNNVVVFEGVSCALGILTGRLQVLDTSNKILFDVGTLPDITFPRKNVNKYGQYTKRPSKTWVVARV